MALSSQLEINKLSRLSAAGLYSLTGRQPISAILPGERFS
ncbi:hypothetical protein HMPREF1619_04011 [Klebsiella pneumoniae 909957]|nr:hypothetical protein HMPREF1619_04011 [Klebsiella pneumoniae 909957]